MIARWAKIIMCLSVAALAGLAALGNVLDYDTNFVFVRHVLTMDTVASPAFKARAITAPALWHFSYGLIIAGEAATALLFAGAGLALWRVRRGSAALFQRAKSWAHAGALAGFLVWFFGFMVIGGEWFQMWQSAWNGQEAAFRFFVSVLAVTIFVNQPDQELV